MTEEALYDLVDRVFSEVDELYEAGRPRDALARLRESIGEASSLHDDIPPVKTYDDGHVGIYISPAMLTLRARESLASLDLGQSASQPHEFLGTYESLSPILPEREPRLRLWMTRLRIQVAHDHASYLPALAWALDLYRFAKEMDWPSVEIEALSNTAALAGLLGFSATRDRIRAKLASDPRYEDHTAPEFRWYQRLVEAGITFESNQLEARRQYERLLAELLVEGGDDDPDVISLRVRVQRRLADCARREGDLAGAGERFTDAYRAIDRVRELSAYQAVRNVDRGLDNELEHLQALSLDMPDLDVQSRVLGYLVAGNSSVASAIREAAGVRASGGELRILLQGNEREARLAAEMLRKWAPISDADVENCLRSDTPSLLLDAVRQRDGSLAGWTALVGRHVEPTVHHWHLTDAAADFALALLAPPDDSASDDHAWNSSPTDPMLARVSEQMLLPLATETELSGLRVCPSGLLWRLPFLGLVTPSGPLGSRCPVVISTPLAKNVPHPGLGSWLGHFDLSLKFATADLGQFLNFADKHDVAVTLFDSPTDVANASMDLLAFSGHGGGTGPQQFLKFATGKRLYGDEVTTITRGVTVVLDACWSGAITDQSAKEQTDLSLMLVARGAHTVVGTLGPVRDSTASRIFVHLVEHLASGLAGASAMHRSILAILNETPTLPLAAWASFLSVGRDTTFAVEDSS